MTLPPRFDPAAPENVEDPYPAYAALRAAGSAARGALGQVVVARYPDVASLLRSPRLSNEFPDEYRQLAVGPGPASEFLGRVLLHRDPPAHAPLRALLSQPLLKTRMSHWAERAEAITLELLEEAMRDGKLDAATDLALPLPILMVCEILGVPIGERALVRPHAAALSRAFTLHASNEQRDAADRAVRFLREYLRQLLVDSSSGVQAHGLLSVAREACESGAQLDEVIDNLAFLFFAGFETTANLIATGAALLAQHPFTLAELRRDASLMPAFIDEVLRFDAPIQSRARRVVEPISVGDQPVRVGRIVLLLIGSANRDEQVFEHPDVFDIHRPRHPHLSFGAGGHYCLGAQLARLEAAALFGNLLQRCEALWADVPPTRDLTSVFRSYSRVPLCYA
jgi:cytochrome P450